MDSLPTAEMSAPCLQSEGFFAVNLHRHSGAKALSMCITKQLVWLPRADLTSLTSQTSPRLLHKPERLTCTVFSQQDS